MKAPKKVGSANQYTYGWQPPDREWLENQFQTQGKTISKVSEECGAAGSVVRRWIRELGIGPLKILPNSPPKEFPNYGIDGKSKWVRPGKKWLEQQHLTLRKSLNQISEEVGASWRTVEKWFLRAEVEVRRDRQGQNNPAWKGGTTRNFGKNVLFRSEIPYKCSWCGSLGDYNKYPDYDMHLHHKDHDKRNNVLENLCWLCATCHRLETALWHMLKQDKIDLACKENQMIITFRGGN